MDILEVSCYLNPAKLLNCHPSSSFNPGGFCLVFIRRIYTEKSCYFSGEIPATCVIRIFSKWFKSYVLTWTGIDGWSWQRGEREVHGSLYWEVLRARAAIWLVRLGWRPRVKPGVPTGFGEEHGTMEALATSWLWAVGTIDTLLTLGQRGLDGTFLNKRNELLSISVKPTLCRDRRINPPSWCIMSN